MKSPRLLAALVVIALSAACGSKNSTAEPPTSPKASASTTTGRVITFGKTGVVVQSAKDAVKLAGTSDAFKKFIGAQADKLQRPKGATDCFVGITVEAYDPAGFARGGVNECGGYAALWGRKDGAWKQLLGTQDAWMCDELKKLAVPAHGVVDTCVGGTGTNMKETPYTG